MKLPGGHITLTAAVLALSAVLSGCSGTSEPPRRVLIDAQARAFADRVLAEPTFALDRYSPTMRAAIEEDGRALCSHMLIGVPWDQAHDAAYPPLPGHVLKPADVERRRILARHAADILCPYNTG
jgi:hypothetical protein